MGTGGWRAASAGGWTAPEKRHAMSRAPVKEEFDEVLEQLWLIDEQTKTAGPVHACVDEEFGPEVYEGMVTTGLIERRNGDFALTASGHERAARVVRNQRLVERLLTDVLQVSESAMATQACEFEHYLHDEVVESICTLLGHPRRCPHGYAIPRRPCCHQDTREVGSVICRLTELRAGQTGTVVYIETTEHQRLDRLMAFGLLPGREVRVHQVRPTLVLFIGETQLALDADIAEGVHVRRGGGE